MKKIYTLLMAVIITTLSFAQAPHKMSYQAVIRGTEDNLVTEQEIGMKISILQGSADGTVVYTEIQTPTTNKNGLVSIEIGGEAGFAIIDWSDGPYFIKTETDPEGGTDYSITGTNQLLTVPYALHSKTSDILTGEITENQISDLQNYLTGETDPLFDAWDKSEGITITESQITDLQTYLTDITEQTISELSDIDVTGLEADMVLKYDADIDKWIVAADEGIIKETDPIFMESAASAIEYDDIDNWNEAYSWGDHADESYLETETDPVFAESVASDITASDTTNWNEAYGWSDHSEAEYLTEEEDPVFASSVASDITQEDLESWDSKSEFDGEFSSLAGVPNSAITPSGVISIFAGNTAPDGYLICDGSEVSRTEYADLFAVIGTTYGEGDGATTFNLPNLQGRVPLGISTEPEFNELGNAGGATDHVLTTDEMPAHNHTASASSAGSHTHSATTNMAGSHSHEGVTQYEPPHQHNYSVRTSHNTGGTNFSGAYYAGNSRTAATRSTSADGYHNHALVIHQAGIHEHQVFINDSEDHTHSVTVNNNGSGIAHNNLQPYIVVNFIIKY